MRCFDTPDLSLSKGGLVVRARRVQGKGDDTVVFQVATEVRVFLTREGVDLSGEQETKTRKALEFFSNRLKQAPAQ